MQDTPVYQTLKKVAEAILPLTLVDPKSPDFNAEHCRSLHDLGRLVHELSYTEMFQISDLAAEKGGGAVKLEALIPLDLYLIDLGDGLTPEAGDLHRVTVDQIASVPLRALLRGLLHPDLRVRAGGKPGNSLLKLSG